MTEKIVSSDFMGNIIFTPIITGFFLAIAIDMSFRVSGYYFIAVPILIGGVTTGYMINGSIKKTFINCGILGFILGIILALFNLIQYFLAYSAYQIQISDILSYALSTVAMGAIAGAIIAVIGGIIGSQINKKSYCNESNFKPVDNPVKKEKIESEDINPLKNQMQGKVECSSIKSLENRVQENIPTNKTKSRDNNPGFENKPPLSSNMKECPHCKSEIPADATKCKYCGESVELSGVKLSGVGRRIAAVAIDSIIIALFWGISTYLINFSIPVNQTYSNDSSSTSLVVFPMYTLILFAYFILLEGPLGKGQTIGKRILKIRVVNSEDQSAIDYSVSFIRNILRIIDGLFLYLIGFLSIQGSDKEQRIGDKAAKTIVIKI